MSRAPIRVSQTPAMAGLPSTGVIESLPTRVKDKPVAKSYTPPVIKHGWRVEWYQNGEKVTGQGCDGFVVKTEGKCVNLVVLTDSGWRRINGVVHVSDPVAKDPRRRQINRDGGGAWEFAESREWEEITALRQQVAQLVDQNRVLYDVLSSIVPEGQMPSMSEADGTGNELTADDLEGFIGDDIEPPEESDEDDKTP